MAEVIIQVVGCIRQVNDEMFLELKTSELKAQQGHLLKLTDAKKVFRERDTEENIVYKVKIEDKMYFLKLPRNFKLRMANEGQHLCPGCNGLLKGCQRLTKNTIFCENVIEAIESRTYMVISKCKEYKETPPRQPQGVLKKINTMDALEEYNELRANLSKCTRR